MKTLRSKWLAARAVLAALASSALAAAGSSQSDAWFDRSRQLLHCNGQAMERGSTVVVFMQGQRVDESWTLTAMNAVEVTLREAEVEIRYRGPLDRLLSIARANGVALTRPPESAGEGQPWRLSAGS